jgi:hypothetical protein
MRHLTCTVAFRPSPSARTPRRLGLNDLGGDLVTAIASTLPLSSLTLPPSELEAETTRAVGKDDYNGDLHVGSTMMCHSHAVEACCGRRSRSRRGHEVSFSGGVGVA